MKKKLTIIALLILFCSTTFGQSIDWGEVPNDFDSNMSLFGIIQINGENPTSDNLEIAAFCGDELRGTEKTFKHEDKCYVFITFGGYEVYEEIGFKLYDPATNKVYNTEYTTTFIPDGTIGEESNPEQMNFISMYWDQNDVVEYECNMTVRGVINIDGIPQDRDDLEIAAFSGDELRGIARPIYYATPNKHITDLMIQGKGNETITFKLYDHSGNIDESVMPLVSDFTVTFEDNKILSEDLNFVYNSVAKIGDVYYPTLKAAVENAGEEATITLLKNAEGSGVVIDKSLTIDFGGYTYTFTTPAVGSNGTTTNGFQILKNNTVTLQNGTLNVADVNKGEYAILIQNYANLTLSEMTVDATNVDYTLQESYTGAWAGYSYALSINSGEVNITNSKIIANNEGQYAYAFDVCKYSNYAAPVVTLGENVTIAGNVEFTGGELYANQNVINIVAKKEFKKVSGVVGSKENWGTISTPIKEAEIPTATAGVHDLYRYDEETMNWYYYTGENAAAPFDIFKLGEGYLYANKEDITIELKGELNNSPVSFDLSYTDNALAGFHFIGNPFLHSISEANFTTTDGATLSNGFYVITPEGAFVAKQGDAKIAPMESVMIQTNKATKLTINNTVGAKRAEIENNGSLAINVSNSNYSDMAYVSFNEGKGLNKISHRNAEIPMVYVPVEGENYAVAIMDKEVTEVPVSFKAATMGEYTISVEAQDCEYAMMTLVDRLTGIETNLLIEDYTFIAKSNDNPNRFIIKLAMTNNNGGSVENFAFINNGMMYIYNIEGQGVVSVYDVTGRPVAEYNVATSANIATSDFASGMYIIRMSDENGIKVQKIVIE